MATRGQIQLINSCLETLRRHSKNLVQAVNTHVEQITAMTQSWVNNQDTSGTTFQDISNKIAESVSLILDRVEDFQAGQGAEGGDGRPSSTQQLSTTDSSLSFTVLESSTSSSSPSSEKPKPSKPHSDQLLAQILNRLDNIENDSVKIKDLDQRLGQIEKERREVDGEKVKEVEGRLDHIENSLKDLTTFAEKVQRVEERIQALHGLDEEVKNLQENRKADLKIVDDIRAEVSTLSAQLQVSKKQPVGFTVQKPAGPTNITTTLPVTFFTQIRKNTGGHYNPSTREFTAPVDGVYLSSLIHTQAKSDGMRKLQVVCKRIKDGPGGEREDVLCETWTEAPRVSCTDVGVVYMSAGDRLYVKVVSGGEIYAPSVFSCYLIH